MKSKTSFFDRAIFARSLKTAAIPAALYTLLLIFLLPAQLPQIDLTRTGVQQITGALLLKREIYSFAPYGVLAFFYGLLLAWLLFFFLFRTSAAYRYAAMPVRREALFGTNFLVGVLAFAAPHAIIALVTFFVTAALGHPLALACLQWFAVVSCECLFFFSFAALLVMIVGQMAAMPVVYVILSFAVALLYEIFVNLLQLIVYGMPQISSIGSNSAMLFSPPVVILSGGGPQGFHLYNEAFDVIDIALGNAWYAWALGAVGLVFAVLALLLFKKREMERCGDVVAIKKLRPLFLYAFTFGCAFVIAAGIMRLLNMSDEPASVWTILLLLFLGAFIGYFGAQMMLKKTVRVFTKGWLGFGMSCAVLAVAIGFFALDLTGYEARVPEKENVSSVSLSLGRYATNLYPVTDEAAIEDILSLHENILAQQDEQRAMESRSDYYNGFSSGDSGTLRSFYVSFTYTLQNGKELSRSYVLSAEAGCTDPTNPLVQFTETYNSLSFALARWAPPFDVTADRVTTCEIDGYDETGEPKVLNLSSSDTYAFYTECVLPDFAATSLGRTEFNLGEVATQDAASAQDVELTPVNTARWIGCELFFTFRDESGNDWSSSNLTVTQDAARTLAYLDTLGFNTNFGYSEG